MFTIDEIMGIKKNDSSEISPTEFARQAEIIQNLTKELETIKIYFSELEQTNNHLVSATWRERDVTKNLRKEIENLKIYFNEVETTNNHLIAATWRERDIKRQLKETLDELNNTKQIVEKQNKRILESINYARRIQLAINATENNLREELPDSFIYYKPKDVISGDFPWYYKSGDNLFFAAVDCTGHGVPGAMLSIIGNLLLNDIVSNHPKMKTAEILETLHKSVVHTLKQNYQDNFSSDGMDIALCKIDTKKKRVYFSGAHRPLLMIKKTDVLNFKGDRFPIGGMQYKDKNTFKEQMIPYEANDILFIFSDGYPDQIGGEENKKFTTNQLTEMLINTSSMKMNEIENNLEKTLNSWMGTNKQIDDILVIGVKF